MTKTSTGSCGSATTPFSPNRTLFWSCPVNYQQTEQLLAALSPFFPDCKEIGSYVDGELIPGDGVEVRLINPSTGAPFIAYRDAGARVVARAAEAAMAGQRQWVGITHAARGRVMQAIAQRLRGEVENFAQLEALSAGKPIRDCRVEVTKVAEMFEYYAGWADKF